MNPNMSVDMSVGAELRVIMGDQQITNGEIKDGWSMGYVINGRGVGLWRIAWPHFFLHYPPKFPYKKSIYDSAKNK